jgi:hypothetical protein
MRSVLLALLVCIALWDAPVVRSATDNAPRGAATYEERAAAEKKTRSRYRRLEVASLVLILAAGGAAVLWAVRRR